MKLKPFKEASVHELDFFVKKTTVTDEKRETVKFIMYFIMKNNCSLKVRNFLSQFLLDEELLEKTVVVNSNVLYETVIDVESDDININSKKDIYQVLDIYKHKAETIFLNLTSDECTIKYNGLIPQSKYLNSPYSDARKNKQRERENWKNHFEQNKMTILDILLDEYNEIKLLNEWLEGEKELEKKMENWIKVIEYCTK